ncbi:MAG: PAS domain S-box protein, partial [Candidatus Hodarchaeota archaeon]
MSEESVSKYQKIFEAIPDLYFLVDENGKHLDFKGNEELLYLTPDMFLGKTIEQTLPEHVSKIYYKAIKKTLETKEPTVIEYALPIKNIMHHYEARNLYFSENLVAIFVRDITKRKQLEQEILNEKKFTDAVINAQRDTLFVFEPSTGKAIRWNKAFSDISGYSNEEIANMKVPDSYYSKLDLEKATRATKEVNSEGKALVEMNLIIKDGKAIPFEYIGTSITDEEGNIKYIVSIGRDITERKKTEQKLKESEEKFRNITEESHLAICIIQDNIIKYVNQQMATLYGYTVEEMYNWEPGELLKVVGPESLETVKEQLGKKQVGDPEVIIHYPIQIMKKNGDLCWVDNISKTITYEGRPADLVTQIDITEIVNAERTLKESENKYRILFEQAPDMIWIIDPETGLIIETNNRVYDILGYTREEFKIKNIVDIEVAETALDVKKHINEILTTGGDFFETQHRTKTGDV